MANTVTLAQLRTRASERADMVDSQFISPTEQLSYINASYAELYDLLVASFEDYYTLSPLAFTISSGNTYALPTGFYKLRGVDLVLSSTESIPLRKFNFAERNARDLSLSVRGGKEVQYRIVGDTLHLQPAASAAGNYQLWYIPIYTPLAAESDTVNGIQAWEEYIVVDVAIKMLTKEESDTSSLEREKANLLRRIQAMAANRDVDQPERISDTSEMNIGINNYRVF